MKYFFKIEFLTNLYKIKQRQLNTFTKNQEYDFRIIKTKSNRNYFNFHYFKRRKIAENLRTTKLLHRILQLGWFLFCKSRNQNTAPWPIHWGSNRPYCNTFWERNLWASGGFQRKFCGSRCYCTRQLYCL